MANECLNEIRNNIFPPNEPPLVSVATIAYNVESYIAQCIESVLEQKTNFKVELVIGEDCSTDNTMNIILEYRERYPEIIRVVRHEKNIGLTPNSIATQNACKGKYIAMLDGDDYWTDSNKLQKQVSFLESNPAYAGSGHQSIKIYEDGAPSKLFGEETDKTYLLLDTITHRKFHTSSLVYRKEIWDKAGGIPPNISSNERAMYPMIALEGPIMYFKDVMCVYRLSGLNNLSSRINVKELETDFNMIPWLGKLDPTFPEFRFRSFIHLSCFTYGSHIGFRPLIKHYVGFLIFSLSYFPHNLGDIKWGTIFFFRRLKSF